MSDVEESTVRERFSSWWHKAVVVRVKALVYTSAIVLILVTAFQAQNVQLNNARVKDVEDRQDQLCLTRIATRDDLRSVLFYVVDLSDVLPGVSEAVAYTSNRRAFIDEKYPPLTQKDCD